MNCLEQLLEPTRVARVLGVEVETLGAWRRKGYGPRWYRIGKKVRYSEADLRLWMSTQAQLSLSPPQADPPEISRAANAETAHRGQDPVSDLGARR